LFQVFGRLDLTDGVGFGSKVSLSATSILRQLSGVEQTKTGENGPLAADLLVLVQ